MNTRPGKEIIEKAKELRGMGLPYVAIGRRLGVSTETARRYVMGEDAYYYEDKDKTKWPEWREWETLNRKYGKMQNF